MRDSEQPPRKRDALLVAVGNYSDSALGRLRSPSKDATGLAAVLGDPDIGQFRVSRSVDEPSYQIMQVMERFFADRARSDTLLLHMSCHGLRDAEGILHFAASNTSRELLASTAISSDFLKLQLRRCRARSIVVLLDCCFSGAFFTGMKGDPEVHVAEELSGLGVAVLTATNRTEYAWEGGDLVRLEPAPSKFTAAVIEGLHSGEADRDGDGRVAVDELYDHVYERLRKARTPQTPQMWAQLEHRIFIARAPASQGRRTTSLSGSAEEAELPPVQFAYRSGRDTYMPVELTLPETAFGCTRKITFETKALCEYCAEASAWSGGACPVCQGARRISTLRTITVRFPAGIENGTRIQLEGEGDFDPNGAAPGDIYLEVVERRHLRFTRNQDDLRTRLTIPASIAASGGIAEIRDLAGAVIKIRVPRNTPSRTVLRVRSRGTPHLNGQGRGDMFIELLVQDGE